MYGKANSKRTCIRNAMREVAVRSVRAQMRYDDIVETNFIDLTDFVLVQYLVTNTAAPCKSLFHFKVNILKASSVWRS
jgi:hypothetical protein